MNRLRLARALAIGLMTVWLVAHSQVSPSAPTVASSVSGQFVVTVEPENFPYYHHPETGTNADFVRLDAPFLVVSVERFKAVLGRELALAPNAPWSGKISLNLHAARTTNETVAIVSQPLVRHWNYRLELPDLLTRNRYARAISAVLLLEQANRHADAGRQAAALPPWLTDGLAMHILEADNGAAVVSEPTKNFAGLIQTRTDEQRHHLDALARARRVLQNSPALTFDQLSWPTDAQADGADGGVYLASAQLFVHELLELKNGAGKLRAMLAQLPACANWQTAFFAAFHEDFQRPLDAEKWWSLRVVNFAAREPGPQWIATVSRKKLDAILAVPVAVRYATNELPVRAEISLQAAVQNFAPPRRTEILQTKLRDLELVQLRLAPPLAALADGYRTALAEFLGVAGKRASGRHLQADTEGLIRRLDDLDARRRDLVDKLERMSPPGSPPAT
jgi:hypothetical protein